MSDLEKIIHEEISTLDALRLMDVIGFIRYIKGGRSVNQKLTEEWFESTLKEIHNRKSDPKAAKTESDTQRRKRNPK